MIAVEEGKDYRRSK